MPRLLADLRFAARGLLKTPTFTIGVVLTLALGIGINATMFGVVDTLFLRTPAGVARPDGVVRLYFRQDFGGAFGAFTLVFALSRSYVLSLVALACLAASDMLSMFIRSTLGPLLTPPELTPCCSTGRRTPP